MAVLVAGCAGGSIGRLEKRTDVLNEQDEEVGVWYSAISITVVKTVGPSEITVAPPNPIEIEKLQQSRGR